MRAKAAVLFGGSTGVFLLVCLLALVSHSAPVEPGPMRPNILLLVAEDMSARVGAFGDPVARTPNLDQLAVEGTRYPRVFTTAGVCAPSRAALLTGMHAISMGGQHMRSSTRPAGAYAAVPPAGVRAFPELLRAGGYFTFTDSKLDYQFSGVFAGSGPSTIWDAEGEGLPWLEEANVEQPFFGLVNFQVTHESGVFTPLGEGWPKSVMHFVLQVVRAWQLGIPEEGEPVGPDEVELPPYYADTPTVRGDLARHYNNIASMDREVGEILASLEAAGLADSTIVLWTTDHGDGLPRAKRELYDSGLHVPLIVRWPDRWRPDWAAPGALEERLISFVDLAPTILAWAGVGPPDFMQGNDFTDLTLPAREYVYASRDRIDAVEDRERAVRDGEYKYIRSWYPDRATGHPLAFRDNLAMMIEMWELLAAGGLNEEQRKWFEPTGSERLYHLASDPYELTNLAGEPAHAETLARMRSAYADFALRVPDWSEEGERAMVERMWPGGKRPQTGAPILEIHEGRVRLEATTPHASLAYSLDSGPSHLYTGPFEASPGSRVEAWSVRYGYAESEKRARRVP
ncbi:MAG: sulfatase [Myxococcota bacterium]|nr:sulfatase [Myxococcota bacterium]